MEALRRRLIPRRTIPSSNKAIFRQYVPRDNPAPIGIFLMNEKRVGRGCVVLRQGDITESDVDAIVNAANNHLWMGAGVAGAIKRKGGEAIEAEAVSKGPIRVGDAVITDGGELPARHVIHAAGMGTDLRTSPEIVEACTRASLEVAEENSLGSIAFPAIGTGVGGLDVKTVASCMLKACSAHMQRPTGMLAHIEFVLFSDADLAAFRDALEAL